MITKSDQVLEKQSARLRLDLCLQRLQCNPLHTQAHYLDSQQSTISIHLHFQDTHTVAQKERSDLERNIMEKWQKVGLLDYVRVLLLKLFSNVTVRASQLTLTTLYNINLLRLLNVQLDTSYTEMEPSQRLWALANASCRFLS